MIKFEKDSHISYIIKAYYNEPEYLGKFAMYGDIKTFSEAQEKANKMLEKRFVSAVEIIRRKIVDMICFDKRKCDLENDR
jgi:hypothetical protein